MTDESRVPVSLSLDAWLDRLSQRGGEPGGGAASGVMMAIGAALLHMVAAYTPDDERAQQSGQRSIELRIEALRAAEDDGVRSAALGAALAAESSPERDERIVATGTAGAESSATLVGIGAALAAELRVLADRGNPHLIADVAVAAEAIGAGLGGALTNLRACLTLALRHLPEGQTELPTDFDGAIAGGTAARDDVARLAHAVEAS
ncbi:MAG: cyclodeaminase/cyclohydrolase family protein [Microbacterium sp.]|uniref:cyclodeaminase/cyclohydrolase family protein n=1 Tax=Microbacterium sp. TaxID=51671 RepID=UPI00271627BF|nr:cyclodeaminase/cyclohydrolase family protein [Microbacterium sp.]MDO8381570.1 cyclodeaminase/cyclohydrolase family protein [Microbacterium sp.]